MFEASLQAKRIERGQTIEGTIVAIGPEVAFVDGGSKGEATIDVAELKDENGALEVAVGDRVQAVVTSTAGGLTLSRRLARGAATQRQLEDAFRRSLPVEGKVERAGKGGYAVRIARQRGLRAGETYEVGQVRRGRVTRLAEFGAFVELEPGIEALAHASTFAPTARSDAWTSLVRPGTDADFEIVTIDLEKKRIGVALVPEGSARASARDEDDAHERADGDQSAPQLGSLADKLRRAL